MTQFGLFNVPLALLDGERGRVTFHPGFLPIAEAEAHFETFRAGIDWRANRRVMYEREVDVPRLTAHFALDALSSMSLAKAVADKMPKGISDDAASTLIGLAERIRLAINAPFNSVGFNFYRDGNDSVAPHNDRLQDLIAGQPIVLLSLGATRRMMIRSKQSGEAAIPVDLDAGSLLVMDYASQLHYTHGIGKTRASVAERISIAFRVRPER